MNLPQDDILDGMNRLTDGPKQVINTNGTPASSYLVDSMDVSVRDDTGSDNDRTQVRRAVFVRTVFTPRPHP